MHIRQGCIHWCMYNCVPTNIKRWVENFSFVTSSSSSSPSDSSSSASYNNISNWNKGKIETMTGNTWIWLENLTLLKYLSGLGHKSSLIISPTYNIMEVKQIEGVWEKNNPILQQWSHYSWQYNNDNYNHEYNKGNYLRPRKVKTIFNDQFDNMRWKEKGKYTCLHGCYMYLQQQ